MADPPPDVRAAPMVAAVLPIARPVDEDQARLDFLLQRARADTHGIALAGQLAEISDRLRERPGEFEEMLALIERRKDNMEAEIERRVGERAALLERDAETRRAVQAEVNDDMLRAVLAMRDESHARIRELEERLIAAETAAAEATEREEQLREDNRTLEEQKEQDDRVLGQVLTEFVRQGNDHRRAEHQLRDMIENRVEADMEALDRAQALLQQIRDGGRHDRLLFEQPDAAHLHEAIEARERGDGGQDPDPDAANAIPPEENEAREQEDREHFREVIDAAEPDEEEADVQVDDDFAMEIMERMEQAPVHPLLRDPAAFAPPNVPGIGRRFIEFLGNRPGREGLFRMDDIDEDDDQEDDRVIPFIREAADDEEVDDVSDAQRAAWQVERNENEQPDNLALRYARRCAACLCENPRVRAVLTACGHSSLCMPCAEEATGGRARAQLDCLICRARSGYVRLWEDLENEMAPQAGHEAPEAAAEEPGPAEAAEEQPGPSEGRKRRKDNGDDDDEPGPAPRRSMRLAGAH